MNINRKRAFLKKEKLRGTLAMARIMVDNAKLNPYVAMAMNFSAATSLQGRLYRISCTPTDPFDVLDLTQVGYIPPPPIFIGTNVKR